MPKDIYIDEFNKLSELDKLDLSQVVLLLSDKFQVTKDMAKRRIEEIVGDDVLFYPCKVNLRGELLEFHLAKIFRKLPIIDMENCPFRTLSNGKRFPHILIDLPRKR